MNLLVTGGAGYIGSHASLRLLEAGHRVTIVDDLSRGNEGAIAALRAVGDVRFERADVADRPRMTALLRDHAIEAVMHFAALAYVGESIGQPLRYYRNNTVGALALLEAMDEAGVGKMIFSSSCATYGVPPAEDIPIRETCRLEPITPYGRSKLHGEHILTDHAATPGRSDFAFTILRYFNVAGCDRQGRLGEDHDPETHLVPICLDAALGSGPGITIFGDDYETPDGTCIRDYVHVEDIAGAHVAALEAMKPGERAIYNVGIGRGYSVLEVLEACRRVTGAAIPARVGARRVGDPPMLYADPTRITTVLGWQAEHTDLDATIETAWRWRQTHPSGYGG